MLTIGGNMKRTILVTGGAGFIGRWVVKALLDDSDCRVVVLDDFSNGMRENLAEFRNEPRLIEVKKGSIGQDKLVAALVKKHRPEACIHLAAQINVQDSIDDPASTFNADVEGTFRLLEICRAAKVRFAFMSTCMVYDLASAGGAISEEHPVVPRSPYAGAKLAGEHLSLSYYHAYGMPVTVMRPFNTYGPHQKASGEGGVVSIFLARAIKGQDLNIYGSGKQTRDLLYVEDCADFVIRAAFSKKAEGRIINAATSNDIAVNDLAKKAVTAYSGNGSKIKWVKHIHPQSEIMKLCGASDKALKLLNWKPKTTLDQGLEKTGIWLRELISKGNEKWL